MKMKKRDPLTAPNVGDRVQYVIIEGPKGMAMADRCEDPLHVLENGASPHHKPASLLPRT